MTTTRRNVTVGQSTHKVSSSSATDDPRKQVKLDCLLLLRESVILKFGQRMAILYWFYQVVLVATYLGKQGGGITPMSSSTLLSHKKLSAGHDDIIINFGLNGGFCPPTHCTIGTTSIHNVPTKKSTTTINPPSNNSNNTLLLITTKVNNTVSFQMFIRDPTSDTYISGLLATGQKHDPKIHNLVIRVLSGKTNALFIDIGANIGYFTATALAVGARTISFEPYYYNAHTLLSTIHVNNGWSDRSTLIMNTLGYESNRVTMKSTNDEINKSNMHITESVCGPDNKQTKKQQQQQTQDENNSNNNNNNNNNNNQGNSGGEYGIDYMDEVSLDQVLLQTTNNSHIIHHHHVVTLMKIDVETYEIHVLNGAMYSLCNIVIEHIVMEVEYLKPSYNNNLLPLSNNTCSFDKMRQTLIRLGYEILDLEENGTVYTDVDLQELPSDVLFRLNDFTQSPATRLRGSVDNPCAKFDLQIPMTIQS